MSNDDLVRAKVIAEGVAFVIEGLYGTGNPELPLCYADFADSEFALGNLKEARQHYKHAQKLAGKLAGTEHELFIMQPVLKKCAANLVLIEQRLSAPDYISPEDILNIGITGHRRLPGDQRVRIQEQVKEILLLLKSYFADVYKLFRIISCLADGADQLVAQVGLEQGYQLEAVLPFPRSSEVHRRDRTDGQDSLDAFDSLVAQAVQVIELFPDYSDDLPWDSAEAKSLRHKAYAKAGQRMLGGSDYLITIWNGKSQECIGGTAHTIEQAKYMEIPMFWIHSEESMPVQKPHDFVLES